ncbi:MAG TPA: hypothetical protein VFW73_07105 [Lacipirellulaceae bacterium]|nr:hypothetical protein [Lacipirellulaceae bacterium]
MISPTANPDAVLSALLEETVGYLNFSSGSADSKFLRAINALFAAIEHEGDETQQPAIILFQWLERRMDDLSRTSTAFGDVTQARSVVELLRHHFLPAYRAFHRDLLWHQSDRDLWRPLFLGRAFEAILSQSGPWNETKRIVDGALEALNDYLGYRPVAVLESETRATEEQHSISGGSEPYAHERVCPIPLYIKDVGVAPGVYKELVEKALAILNETDPDILHQAWFDPQLLEELAVDPRAYDFDHPASKRPNHHFGQWDLHRVDNRGYYRRFVLQQVTLDAMLSRVNGSEWQKGRRGGEENSRDKSQVESPPLPISPSPPLSSPAPTRDELLFEAAAVLAGTILMASGTTGNRPDSHSSDVTLSNLLPHIAAYRDQFYEELLTRSAGPHAQRLRAESKRTRQPFGGARQHLNQELARRRAVQMQHVHLAQLYARMGYPDAAQAEANGVLIASARMLCHIYCLLTAGHQAIDAHELDTVAKHLPEIEELLHRGIECGALVDPWNVVGFGGNFSLFPAIENTVRDFRVDDLIELVEQILDLSARAWTEAAALDDAKREADFSAALARLATWWDKYATASVSGVKRLVGKEIEVSTNLVAGALSAWHKAGAAAGDVKFWRMFVDQFDSPKAFQLVVEALLERGDHVAAMALMLQWVSQVEYTPLEDGDASFHPLALRWLRSVEEFEHVTGTNQWPLVAKFLQHLEASAEVYWQVPAFELAEDGLEDLPVPASALRDDDDDDDHDDDTEELPFDDDDDDDESWLDHPDDETEELFGAAYEGMVFRGSTDDGFDSDLIDNFSPSTEFELEEEAERLAQRLEFLSTVARLWRHIAITWKIDAEREPDRRQLHETWCREAMSRYERLLELAEAVHRFPIGQPSASQDSMVEADRQRMIKDTLLEHVVATCVETAHAGRMILAASSSAADGTDPTEDGCTFDDGASIDVLRGVLAADAEAVLRHWPVFTEWLAAQELLYVPISKGGRPRRIVHARALGQLLDDLLTWLPRLGLIRETCQLLDIAPEMETSHPVGPGAVTEYDRLFSSGYQSIVRALVASAEEWDVSPAADLTSGQATRPSDSMLVEGLQDLTEGQLNRWLTHSRTLRLSVVERLASDDEWNAFVAFVERYGGDLFTQRFLNLSNLRAILHQRVSVWLSNLEQEPDAEEIRLIAELGNGVMRDEAAKWLTIALEAVVENYREYRDYNTTTTHSDHGELLYTLVDFLRLRADYDRVAWNLRPVVMAHEILVRQNRPAAAELWQQALSARTAETADTKLARFEELCTQYGVRLPSVAERLGERFTRPLAIDRVRALVGPAIAAAPSLLPSTSRGGAGGGAAFTALQIEITSLAQEPAGAGLDLPDWLAALEEEVSMVRCRRRHYSRDDAPRRIEQVRLTWDQWQRQIADDAS